MNCNDILAERKDFVNKVKQGEYLQQYCDAHLMKSHGQFYCCPKCGSGTGKNGTGAAHIHRCYNDDDNAELLTCQSCSKTWNIFQLAQELHNLDFPAAVDSVAAELELDVPALSSAHGQPSFLPAAKPKEAPQASVQRNSERRQAAPTDEAKRKSIERLKRCRDAFPNSPAEQYLQRRGISSATATARCIGWDSDNNCITIPYEVRDGEPGYYYSYRYLLSDGSTDEARGGKDYKPKAEQLGSEPLCFADELHAAAANNATCFVLEGSSDALSIHEVGYYAVSCCTNNANGLKAELEKMQQRPRIVLAFDNDKHGQEATPKAAAELEKLGVLFTVFDYGNVPHKDANAWLQADREQLGTAVETAANTCCGLCTKYEKKFQVLSIFGDFIDTLENAAKAPKYSTGFKELDEVLDGGLRPGLYVLGAVPSLGKTSLALQIAEHVAETGNDALFFSLEMARAELMAKGISRRSMLLRRRAYTTREVQDLMLATRCGDGSALSEAAEQYRDAVGYNLFIVPGDMETTAEKIAEHVAEHVQERKTRPLVIVDYLQIIPARPGFTERQAIDANIRALKLIATKYSLPVLVISAFSRVAYIDGPQETAYKESGGIEYSADVLLSLLPEGLGITTGDKNGDKQTIATNREIMRRCKDTPTGQAREVAIHVLKNRNGRCNYEGTPLLFDAAHNLFEETHSAKLLKRPDGRLNEITQENIT